MNWCKVLVVACVLLGGLAQAAVASSAGVQIAQASTIMVNAEVRKIDKEQGKLTLAHEPIPNLEMPKMTMVFHVKDPAMLDSVKPGDKVRFTADRVGGQLTVTALEMQQ